jgi:hypothetical protein
MCRVLSVGYSKDNDDGLSQDHKWKQAWMRRHANVLYPQECLIPFAKLCLLGCQIIDEMM